MRLLLDELWSPAIARQLRGRGFDVIAAIEPEHARRYAGTDDEVVFAQAQADRSVIVTDNVADFEAARSGWETSQESEHFGLIYAVDPPFNRHRGQAVVGHMVLALADLLRTNVGDDLRGQVHWLRPAPDRAG